MYVCDNGLKHARREHADSQASRFYFVRGSDLPRCAMYEKPFVSSKALGSSTCTRMSVAGTISDDRMIASFRIRALASSHICTDCLYYLRAERTTAGGREVVAVYRTGEQMLVRKCE